MGNAWESLVLQMKLQQLRSGISSNRNFRLLRLWNRRLRRRLVALTAMELARRTWRELGDDFAVDLAASISYYAILSLFPLAIGLVSLFSLILEADAGGIGGIRVLPHLPARLRRLIDSQRAGCGGHSQPAGHIQRCWIACGPQVCCSVPLRGRSIALGTSLTTGLFTSRSHDSSSWPLPWRQWLYCR